MPEKFRRNPAAPLSCIPLMVLNCWCLPLIACTSATEIFGLAALTVICFDNHNYLTDRVRGKGPDLQGHQSEVQVPQGIAGTLVHRHLLSPTTPDCVSMMTLASAGFWVMKLLTTEVLNDCESPPDTVTSCARGCNIVARARRMRAMCYPSALYLVHITCSWETRVGSLPHYFFGVWFQGSADQCSTTVSGCVHVKP